MRISASSTVLALALFGTAGIQGVAAQTGSSMQDAFSSLTNIGTESQLSGIAASTTGVRCEPSDLTRVTSTLQDKIVQTVALLDDQDTSEIMDGCGNNWSNLKGTRRERGSLFSAGDEYSDCDKTKISFRGTGSGTIDNVARVASITSTATIVGEEEKAAWSLVAAINGNRTERYSAPLSMVYNRYYTKTTTTTPPATEFSEKSEFFSSHGLCPAGAGDAQPRPYCTIDPSIGGDDVAMVYELHNPNTTDIRGLKAVVTFGAKRLTVSRFYLPRGSARVSLPAVDDRRAVAGADTNTSSLTIPLASRTLPGMARMSGMMRWEGIAQSGSAPVTDGDVVLTVSRGNTVLFNCTSSTP